MRETIVRFVLRHLITVETLAAMKRELSSYNIRTAKWGARETVSEEVAGKVG